MNFKDEFTKITEASEVKLPRGYSGKVVTSPELMYKVYKGKKSLAVMVVYPNNTNSTQKTYWDNETPIKVQKAAKEIANKEFAKGLK